MGLDDVPGIGVVFGKANEIFGVEYDKAPEPVVTDQTKMGVADPAELDAYLGEIAAKTGLDKSSIEVNDGQSIRIAGGDVDAFMDFVNAASPSYNHEPVGRLDHDDPALGYKGDEIYTLDLPSAAPGL